MSEESFEKLKKLAREEFECEIERSSTSSSFEEVFGIDLKEVKTNNMDQ